MTVAITCLAIAGTCSGAALAAIVARALDLAPLGPGAAGVAVGAAACCALGRRRLASRLPIELDGWFARRRILAIVWCAAAALSVANTARVALFIADPAQQWASAFPPIPSLARHHCVAAYVRAGELAAEGRSSLWNPADYGKPAPDGSATHPVSGIRGLTPYLTDPYEYPPPFVMIPRAALGVTDDYQIIRAAWFGLSALVFWIAFVGFAIWIAGRPGATALLHVPPIALSTPVLLGLPAACRLAAGSPC